MELIARVDKKSAQGEAPVDGVLVVSADTVETGKAGYYGNNVGSMKSMQHLQSSLGKVLAGARWRSRALTPVWSARRCARPT